MASYGERRRHYRIGKKESAISSNKAYRISKRNKNHIIAGAIALCLVVFVKGLLLGMYIAKD